MANSHKIFTFLGVGEAKLSIEDITRRVFDHIQNDRFLQALTTLESFKDQLPEQKFNSLVARIKIGTNAKSAPAARTYPKPGDNLVTGVEEKQSTSMPSELKLSNQGMECVGLLDLIKETISPEQYASMRDDIALIDSLNYSAALNTKLTNCTEFNEENFRQVIEAQKRVIHSNEINNPRQEPTYSPRAEPLYESAPNHMTESEPSHSQFFSPAPSVASRKEELAHIRLLKALNSIKETGNPGQREAIRRLIDNASPKVKILEQVDYFRSTPGQTLTLQKLVEFLCHPEAEFKSSHFVRSPR